MRQTAPIFAVILVAYAVACSSSDDAATASSAPVPSADGGTPSDASDGGVTDEVLQPIVAPKNDWTWVDVPGSSCDDGTPTGFAVNPTDSEDLFVFLDGGGACWDYESCYVEQTATLGPYGKAKFEADTWFQIDNPDGADTIFDRKMAKNPYAGWNMVYVPYCTGDLHSGNNTVTYDAKDGSGSRTFHHAGRTNLELYLKRIQVTFPKVKRLSWVGSSAGGFGVLLSYPLARRTWPDAKGTLIDDSGPPVAPSYIRPELRAAFAGNWKAAQYFESGCTTCLADYSTVIPFLASAYPNDRFAMLSYTKDTIIPKLYFGISEPEYLEALGALTTNRFDPTTNAKYYVEERERHTFVGVLPSSTSNGVALLDWMNAMLNDEPSWASVKP